MTKAKAAQAKVTKAKAVKTVEVKIPKKRGRKPLAVKLAELESGKLPDGFRNMGNALSQYGFAPVVMDSHMAGIKRLWDGTRTICLLCTKGESVFIMDSTRHKLRENDILIVDTGFILDCVSCSRDFRAVMIVASKTFLFSPTFTQPIDLHYYLQQRVVLPLPKDEARHLSEMFEILRNKMEQHGDTNFFNQEIFNSHIVAQLAKTFCYEMFNQYSLHIPLRNNREKMGSREMFILRFLSLLDQHVHVERFLNYYAEMLDITPQYLTTILKSLTGYSANQWVHIMACEKAKHLMLEQRKNLLLVSRELNYPDQPSFSKMFKAQTGITPIKYRKELGKK